MQILLFVTLKVNLYSEWGTTLKLQENSSDDFFTDIRIFKISTTCIFIRRKKNALLSDGDYSVAFCLHMTIFPPYHGFFFFSPSKAFEVFWLQLTCSCQSLPLWRLSQQPPLSTVGFCELHSPESHWPRDFAPLLSVFQVSSVLLPITLESCLQEALLHCSAPVCQSTKY